MALLDRLNTNNEKLKSIQGIINDFPDTAVKFFSSIEKMNACIPKEDTFAIVYGDTYLGTYRYDNNAWTDIGDSTESQLVMNVLNSIAGTKDQYEGYGGTEEEILEVLNKIGG